MPSIRNHSLDAMRLFAAFGIVWAHMQAPFMQIGYLALGLFVILTTVMAVASAERHGLRRFMGWRFRRIGLPWLAWCGLYLALDALRMGDAGRLWRLTDWQSLLVGPSAHLWFLPFVILTAPLAFWSTRLLRSASDVWKAVFPLGLIGAAALAFHDNGDLSAPWGSWASVTIPFFYGILWAAAKRHGPPFAPAVFVLFATLVPLWFWQSLPAMFILAAAAVFEIVLRIRIQARWLPTLGALAFGVYLVHPFVLLVWYKLTLDQLPRSLGAVAVFGGSLALAAVLQWGWGLIMPDPRAVASRRPSAHARGDQPRIEQTGGDHGRNDHGRNDMAAMNMGAVTMAVVTTAAAKSTNDSCPTSEPRLPNGRVGR